MECIELGRSGLNFWSEKSKILPKTKFAKAKSDDTISCILSASILRDHIKANYCWKTESLKNERSATFTHTRFRAVRKRNRSNRKKKIDFLFRKKEVGYRVAACDANKSTKIYVEFIAATKQVKVSRKCALDEGGDNVAKNSTHSHRPNASVVMHVIEL